MSAIQAYLTAPNPANSTTAGRAWIMADDDVVSTETLVRAMAGAMGLPARVVHLPEWLLASTASAGDACKRMGLPAPWNSEGKGRRPSSDIEAPRPRAWRVGRLQLCERSEQEGALHPIAGARTACDMRRRSNALARKVLAKV